MDVVQSLIPLFSAITRARGTEYARAGRVRLVARRQNDIEFLASGSDVYDGRLVRQGSRLLLSCSCPHAADGFYCKHLWAALLAVDREPDLADWTHFDAQDVRLVTPGAARRAAAAAYANGPTVEPGAPVGAADAEFDGEDGDQEQGDEQDEQRDREQDQEQGNPDDERGEEPGEDQDEDSEEPYEYQDEDTEEPDEDQDDEALPEPRRASGGSHERHPVGVTPSEAVRRFLEYRDRRRRLGPNGGNAGLADGRSGTLAPFPERQSGDGSLVWKAPFDRIRDAMARRAALQSGSAPLPAGEVVYIVDVQMALTYDSLAVDLARRERKKNGEWGKPKPLRLRRSQVDQLPEAADRRLVASLLGGTERYAPADHEPVPQRLHVPASLARTLLPALCETGRLFLGRAGQLDSPPLRWDGDEPWQFHLRVRPDEQQEARRYFVTGWLVRTTGRMPLTAPRLVTPGLVFFADSMGALDLGDAWPWLVELRGNPSITVPAPHASRFIETIFTLPNVPGLELPEELQVEERDVAPVPCLRLFHAHRRMPLPGPPAGAESAGALAQPARVLAHLAFDYGGSPVPATEPRAAIFDAGNRLVIRRRLDDEREARATLRRLGFRPDYAYEGGDETLRIDPHRVPRAIRDLIGAGWHVEADGRLYRPFGRSRLSVTSGIDWFELHGEAEFGGQVADLPKLLRALAKGERVVTLSDGSLGLLPEDWLRRFAGIAQLGHTEGNHLRFRPTQVAVLDALLAAEPRTSIDATFAHALDTLRQFDSVTPVDAGPDFLGELRGYQREGVGWLDFLRTFGFGGCLADDMGLGKTVMVLALLDRHREETTRPSLVVAPRSVVFNWLREAERFTPRLRVADYTGASRAGVLDNLEGVNLLVTTYGTLRQDAARLKDLEFEYVVLDESQAIKNAGTASAKAARLLKGRHRLALSGTPIENHVGELWSLFDFLNPGMLGSRWALGRKEAAGTGELPLLARAVRPFILRRTKQQVARDLPERQEETLWCELDGAERRLYDELRDHYRATLLGLVERKGLGRSKMQVLEALLRLRQAACHPGLLDKSRAGGTSAKLEALLPQLAELREEGHKAIVFSQFTSLLAILRRQLDAEGVVYEYLDGQTRDREAHVSRFQDDENCRLFLMSLKAGGLGLNLTAADYVFLLDPWWNPAAEAQAIDRAHRIGQTRPVFAYRLIARDTVEERILDLQRQKRDLAEAIITADNSVVANLTREDLEALLS